jgi:uncharacterized protein (DUF1501 family)
MDKPIIRTRRNFLTHGLGIVGVGASLPNFLIRSAMAGPAAETDQPILVVVQLDGGNDGLASIIPYADEAYPENRPTLRVPDTDLLKIDGYSAFSPALTHFKQMFDDNQLAVVQAVGYPNGNKSHFKSMDIWHTANPTYTRIPREESYGWLGRYCDTAFEDVIDSKLSIAIKVGKSPMAIRGRIHPGLELKDTRSFRYMAAGDNMRKEKLYQDLNSSDTLPEDASSSLDFITKTSSNANRASNEIMELIRKRGTESSYPDSRLGESLQMVSAMIKGNLSTRVFYVSQGGYDTHANQEQRHLQLMTEFSTAMAAFQADLKAQGNADRVLTMAFSEFGRRVKENGSAGTDHGKAGPMFLCGPNVRSGLYGESPSLTALDQGDLAFKVDFRSVYATVLDKWMQTPSQKILGASYEHLDFMA